MSLVCCLNRAQNICSLRILSPKGEFTNCLASCRTMQDEGSSEIKKFKENPWKAWNRWQVPSGPPKSQFLTVALVNCKKPAVKRSREKLVLLEFVNSFKIFRLWLSGKTFLFLNRPTPRKINIFFIFHFSKVYF